MKTKEIRELTPDELRARKRELREQIFHLRLQQAGGQLEKPSELRTLRRLHRPERIQRFLDEEIAYNKEPDGATCYSPALVLRHKAAHCMEGAMFAAAALRGGE